jgi:hypothetical protein
MWYDSELADKDISKVEEKSSSSLKKKKKV